MELPNALFTFESLMTMGGATAAVFVIANGLQRAFNFNPRWLGLALAELISLVGVFTTGSVTIASVFVAIVNGFLIFAASAGVTSMGRRSEEKLEPAAATAGAGTTARSATTRRFLTPWF